MHYFDVNFKMHHALVCAKWLPANRCAIKYFNQSVAMFQFVSCSNPNSALPFGSKGFIGL